MLSIEQCFYPEDFFFNSSKHYNTNFGIIFTDAIFCFCSQILSNTHKTVLQPKSFVCVHKTLFC